VNDPRHLGDALGRIGNEENDQRHDGRLEAAVGERKRHGIALAKFRQARGRARAREDKLGLGGINTPNLGRGTSLNDLFGEGAIAATDVDPAQARARRQPAEKCLPDQAAPHTHVAFVGRPIVKADFGYSHARHSSVRITVRMTG
jgi:hypothetical protein